jgi:hypothetical protein
VLVIKRILGVGALASVGVLGFSALPAGAAHNIGPNVNLKDSGGVLKFKPAKLNLVQGKGKCKSTNYGFSITNKSGATQAIDDGGSFFFDSAPGQVNYLCSGAGTSIFTVEGSGATLTVNVSPKP